MWRRACDGVPRCATLRNQHGNPWTRALTTGIAFLPLGSWEDQSDESEASLCQTKRSFLVQWTRQGTRESEEGREDAFGGSCGLGKGGGSAPHLPVGVTDSLPIGFRLLPSVTSTAQTCPDFIRKLPEKFERRPTLSSTFHFSRPPREHSQGHH